MPPSPALAPPLSGDVAVYHELRDHERSDTRGIVTVDAATNRITSFREKPALGTTDSRLASVVFYCFRASTCDLASKYAEKHSYTPDKLAFGCFMQHLCDEAKEAVYGLKLSAGFQLIGSQVSAEEYFDCMKACVRAGRPPGLRDNGAQRPS